MDPNTLALLLVQQYLSEQDMGAALRETERANGLQFVSDKLPRSSMLLQMVYDHLEAKAAEDVDHARIDHQAEVEDLMQGGASDYPCKLAFSIEGRHSSSITAVTQCPGSADEIITGSGDGTVQCLSYKGDERWKQKLSHGGAISIAVSPDSRRVLVGSMDGTVSILEATTGQIIWKQKVHQKYVVKVLWAPDELSFLTGSWDGSAHVFCQDAAGGFEQRHHVPFTTAVQDVIFLPGSSEVMFALRETNYLRIHKFPDIEQMVQRINMNALQDDHISFSARQLALSPDSRFLLVSTDSPRILLFRVQGYYIMAAAAAGWIYIFHTGTGKVVTTYKAHEQNVRWLAYVADQNVLISCSFDRSVKLWKAETH